MRSEAGTGVLAKGPVWPATGGKGSAGEVADRCGGVAACLGRARSHSLCFGELFWGGEKEFCVFLLLTYTYCDMWGFINYIF